jgi:hypothetical protein
MESTESRIPLTLCRTSPPPDRASLPESSSVTGPGLKGQSYSVHYQIRFIYKFYPVSTDHDYYTMVTTYVSVSFIPAIYKNQKK